MRGPHPAKPGQGRQAPPQWSGFPPPKWYSFPPPLTQITLKPLLFADNTGGLERPGVF